MLSVLVSVVARSGLCMVRASGNSRQLAVEERPSRETEPDHDDRHPELERVLPHGPMLPAISMSIVGCRGGGVAGELAGIAFVRALADDGRSEIGMQGGTRR
jgi:hypothetical protein